MRKSGSVESFAVVDEFGNCMKVEKRTVGTTGSLGRARALPLYYLETGELVNSVGAGEFVVVATGMRLSRVQE